MQFHIPSVVHAPVRPAEDEEGLPEEELPDEPDADGLLAEETPVGEAPLGAATPTALEEVGKTAGAEAEPEAAAEED